MMIEYCVELEPIEDYFFGNERSFGFGRKDKVNYNNYFVISENLPTQTTLLGMMRYFILKRNGLLYKNFNNKGLDENQIKEQERFIGRRSFTIYSDDSQKVLDYGAIKTISPIFLKNLNGQILVRTPYNGKVVNGALELRGLKNHKIQIMDGKTTKEFKLIDKINLKKEDEIRNSFVVLDSKEIKKDNDIFKSHVKVGINLSLKDEGFFKKEYKFFKEYKLCFYVGIDETVFKINEKITDVVYMGMGKSAFKVSIYPENNKIKDQIKNTFKMENNNIYYALSDLACKDIDKLNKYCDLILAKTRNFRFLTTNYQGNNFYTKLNQSGLYNIIRGGSVFFVKDDEVDNFKQLFNDENYTKIGFNEIIEIGGNK